MGRCDAFTPNRSDASSLTRALFVCSYQMHFGHLGYIQSLRGALCARHVKRSKRSKRFNLRPVRLEMSRHVDFEWKSDAQNSSRNGSEFLNHFKGLLPFIFSCLPKVVNLLFLLVSGSLLLFILHWIALTDRGAPIYQPSDLSVWIYLTVGDQ